MDHLRFIATDRFGDLVSTRIHRSTLLHLLLRFLKQIAALGLDSAYFPRNRVDLFPMGIVLGRIRVFVLMPNVLPLIVGNDLADSLVPCRLFIYG
jgi:hypothetical protein